MAKYCNAYVVIAEVVLCVAFAAGCEKVVSGSRDGKVLIWEWETSESAVRALEGHGEAVTSISVSCDGGRVFFCAEDGTVMTWDMSTGTEKEQMSRVGAVDCVACGEMG